MSIRRLNTQGVARMTLIPSLQLCRYLVAGGTAAVVHLAVLAALVELLSIPASVATAAGFCAGCIVNYTLQYYWTFSSAMPHHVMFARYMFVTLVILAINTILFWLFYSYAGIPYLLAQAISTILVVGLNFQANRRYTFKYSG